jgi:hypothetical protein
MNMAHCILGLLCSFIVVGYLRFQTPVEGGTELAKKLRSCHTILIMNIPYLITIISNFLAFYQVVKTDFNLVNHYMFPILTSAFNPCVIVARTSTLKTATTRLNKSGRFNQLAPRSLVALSCNSSRKPGTTS